MAPLLAHLRVTLGAERRRLGEAHGDRDVDDGHRRDGSDKVAA